MKIFFLHEFRCRKTLCPPVFSFQRDVNLVQNCYPGVFLLPADILRWWHLEDVLGFGQVTVPKSVTGDSGNCYGEL